MELKLERPIIFFDLEATGPNFIKDRIQPGSHRS